jgi:hypothetical protein
VFEAPAVVAGLDDVTVVGEPVEHAMVILGSPNTLGHSPNAKLVAIITEVRS